MGVKKASRFGAQESLYVEAMERASMRVGQWGDLGLGKVFVGDVSYSGLGCSYQDFGVVFRLYRAVGYNLSFECETPCPRWDTQEYYHFCSTIIVIVTIVITTVITINP